MKQQVIEHEGSYFHVEYQPRTTASQPRINDVRLAGTNYEPIGPNLMQFLHNTCHVHAENDGSMVATPMLEYIMQEVESHEHV